MSKNLLKIKILKILNLSEKKVQKKFLIYESSKLLFMASSFEGLPRVLIESGFVVCQVWQPIFKGLKILLENMVEHFI